MGSYAKGLEFRLKGRDVPIGLGNSTKRIRRMRELMSDAKAQAAELAKRSKVPAGDPNTTVRIYRMEKLIHDGSETCGPWHIGIYEKDLESISWKYKRELREIPEPDEEGLTMHSGMLCGMLLDRRHIRTWTPWQDTWDALYAAGFRLNVYEVPGHHTYSGKTQVTYYPEQAKLVGEADMSWFRQWRDCCLNEENA